MQRFCLVGRVFFILPLDFWIHITYIFKYSQNGGGKMVAKKGRPTNNPRNIQVRIRMNKNEKEMLDSCSEKLGITKTEVIVLGLKKVYEENQ